MDPRSIPKIARWAAAAAVAIVLVVAGIFARRAWLASQAMRHAPPAVPASVEQRSLEFTFSKVDGQQTVFTIHAAQATEFRGKSRSLLEDVDIVVRGEHGERHDEIHTRACDYDASSGEIVCRGKVALDLGSAPIPGRPAKTATAGIKIETSGVHFERDTGEVSTDAAVQFRFPQGAGSAEGVKYSSRESQIVLSKDVDLTLAPNRPGGLTTDVTAKGGLDYDRATGQLELKGPVKITKGDRSFETASLTLQVDKQLRPERAVAGGGALAEAGGKTRPAMFRADRAEIAFNAQGRAEQVDATGHVVASEGNVDGMQMEAQRAEVRLDAAGQQPRDVFAWGNVRLRSVQAGRIARLRTAALHLTAVPTSDARPEGGKGKLAAEARAFRLERATTTGRATAEWRSGRERLHLEAGRLAAEFGPGNEIRTLRGSGGVKLDREQPGTLPVRTTAGTLHVDFSGGEWTRAEERGNVRATQGDRKAAAQRATWSRTRDEMKLEGDARMSDAIGQTLARRITWNQQTGELRASGEVRTTYFAGGKGETGVAPSAGPANVVAQTLVAHPSTGEAVYTGGARLWQGDEMIQADRLELQRTRGELVATGNVLGAFPQVRRTGGSRKRSSAAAKTAPSGPVLWRVRADTLTYVSAGGAKQAGEGKATLEGRVRAWSNEGQITTSRMVLTMRRDASGRAELAQATGDGGVEVRQGKRWGVARQGLYDAAAGKFVLSGGRPSLHDTSGDLVTGDELTFYVANDTILVESVKGSRTLTRHPIQKK